MGIEERATSAVLDQRGYSVTKCACGKAISPKTKSGRCAKCAAADPAVRAKKGRLTEEQRARRVEQARALSADRAVVAKRTAAMAITVADPEHRRRHSQACHEAKQERMKDPAFRAKLVEAGKRVGALNFWHACTPEAREKARLGIKRVHLAWCPEEYWELNRQLKHKGFLLEERKAIILAEVEGTPEHARRTIANHQFNADLRRRVRK
jgi:hypothetical protein